MSKSLYPYYERELQFLRQMAQEFARQYPSTAGRLLLEGGRSTDPHVERLLEGFALIAGRIHHRLDAEFPELTDALLNVLYPHYLAPIPSFSIVQLEGDATRLTAPTGYRVPTGSPLRTPPIDGLACRYRTCYPIDLWPIRVIQAEWQPPPFPRDLKPPPRTAAVLRFTLETSPAQRFGNLQLERLRLYLDGDPQMVAQLYESMLNRSLAVVFRDPDAVPQDATQVTLPPEQCLKPVGFAPEEALFPFPPHSLPGFRLLTELFAFPQKFHFIDLEGFTTVRKVIAGRRIEVLIFCDQTLPLLEQGCDVHTFRLGCAPVVNLFEQLAEPIPLTHYRSEYQIVPQVRHPLGMEVYSVESVTLRRLGGQGQVEFQPFYAVSRGLQEPNPRTYWYASRRPSSLPDDKGSDVWLSFVDLDFQPTQPTDGVVIVRTLCTNRDLPDRLRQSADRLVFEFDQAAPVAQTRCLLPPTLPVRRTHRESGYWKLISHLTLSHLSINEDALALPAFRELLQLYSMSDADVTDRRATLARLAIDGVTGIRSRQVVRRLGSLSAFGFCRGLLIELELDEEKFIGLGAYLFASVLERYFALHVTINSFTQLSAKRRTSSEPFKTWPPRAGEQPLL